MSEFGTLDSLAKHILAGQLHGMSSWSQEKKDSISNDIVAGWLGEKQDPSLLGPVRPLSELVWRTLYLQQSIIELRTATEFASALPLKKVNLQKSEQLKFIFWVHYCKVGEFQDRLFRLHAAIGKFAEVSTRDKFFLSKKKFSEFFLPGLKHYISVRNFWVHDSEPEFKALKRLSSLELFSTIYNVDLNSRELTNLLGKEATKVFKTEKAALLARLVKDEMSLKLIADSVVKHSTKYARIPFD